MLRKHNDLSNQTTFVGDSKIIQILDKFQGLFTQLGADYPQLRLILSYKFKMDSRVEPSILMNNQRRKSGEQNIFRGSLFLYLILGLFIAFLTSLFQGDKLVLFRFSLFFMIYFLFFFTTLLSYFSTILLDPSDREIMSVRGVDDRTLSMVRLVHAGVYLIGLIIVFAAPTWIFTAFSNLGLVIPLIISTIMMSITIFLFTLFMYILILHFFNGDRLKNIIDFFQIIFTILMYISLQAVNLFNLTTITSNISNPGNFHWWYLLSFPTWQAAPVAWVAYGKFSLNYFILTLLAIVIMVLLMIFYHLFSPRFEQDLEKLATITTSKVKQGHYFSFLQKILNRTNLQKNYFTFNWQMLRYERDFRTRVYPQLGISFVLVFLLPFVWGTTMRQDTKQALTLDDFNYVNCLLIVIPTIIYNLQFSTQQVGMSIFNFAPFNDQGKFLRSTLEAAYFRFIVPLQLLLCFISVAIGEWQGLLIIVNSIIVGYSINLIYGRISLRKMPFLLKYTAQNSAQGMAVGLLSLVIMVGTTALGLLATHLPFGNVGLFVVYALISIFVRQLVFKGFKFEQFREA